MDYENAEPNEDLSCAAAAARMLCCAVRCDCQCLLALCVSRVLQASAGLSDADEGVFVVLVLVC